MRIRSLSFLPVLSIVLLGVIYSCQKEPDAKLDDKKDISSKDPKELSSALKVWHAVRVQGIPPTEKGNDLQLDNSSGDPLYAIAGRYAIIQPEIVSGDVAGYFVRVNGAPDYFKVDYTKPRNTSRKIQPKKSNSFLRLDSAGGNLDSAIVVVLPSDIQAPDTICMTYWAYDNTGNVSNPVDVCVIISSLGSDAGGAWLNGTWRVTSGWDNNSPHDTIIYNKWIGSMEAGYNCDSGNLQWSNYPLQGQSFLVTDSTLSKKGDITYSSNGGMKYEDEYSEKILDYANSSCSNIVMNTTTTGAEVLTGAWSYNSITHKLIIVFEFDESGIPVEEAYEFNTIKVTDKNMVLVNDADPSDMYYTRFEKL